MMETVDHLKGTIAGSAADMAFLIHKAMDFLVSQGQAKPGGLPPVEVVQKSYEAVIRRNGEENGRRGVRALAKKLSDRQGGHPLAGALFEVLSRTGGVE